MKCSRISISSGPRLKGRRKESSLPNMFYFPTATVQYPSAGARGFVLRAALGQFGCMDSLHRISPALRRGRSRSDSRVFPRYSQISECEASGAALPGGGNGEIPPSPSPFLEDAAGGSRESGWIWCCSRRRVRQVSRGGHCSLVNIVWAAGCAIWNCRANRQFQSDKNRGGAKTWAVLSSLPW